MIERVKIKNFQVHLDKGVEFSPGVTTIVGRSDVGKSTILRALRWACLNDFSGGDFITHGKKEVKVLVALDNGLRIIRGKSQRASGNTYKLVVDGKKKVFRSFKNTVPQAIQELLLLNEINFQKQHDSPFWFNESSGEVSRRLNAVIDLSIIDTTLSNVASAVRQAHERQALGEQRLRDEKDNYAKLKEQAARIKDFRKLYTLRQESEQKLASHDQLEAVLESARANNWQQLEAQAEDQQRLAICAERSYFANDLVASLNALIGSITEKQSIRMPPDLAPVDKACGSWVTAKSRAQEFGILVKDVERAKLRAQFLTEQAEAAEKLFHKETSGKKCPICNRLLP